MQTRNILRWRTFLAALCLCLAGSFVLPPPADARRRRRRRAKRLKKDDEKKAKREKAKKQFRKAEQLYSLGQFGPALKWYQAAYKTLPLPAFLFNIGQCYRLLGQYQKAIFFFQGYLRHTRSQRRRAMVETIIGQVEKALAAKQKADAAARKDDARRRKLALDMQRHELEARRKALALKLRREQLKLKMNRDLTGTGPKAVPVYKKWWFWTVIVGGVAAVVGASLGATLGVKTRDVLPGGSLGTYDQR